MSSLARREGLPRLVVDFVEVESGNHDTSVGHAVVDLSSFHSLVDFSIDGTECNQKDIFIQNHKKNYGSM